MIKSIIRSPVCGKSLVSANELIDKSRKLASESQSFSRISFFIPVIFTRKPEIKITAEVQEENNIIATEEKPTYKYKNYGTVKLLHNATGEVQEINMDEYLYRSCCCRDACKL